MRYLGWEGGLHGDSLRGTLRVSVLAWARLCTPPAFAPTHQLKPMQKGKDSDLQVICAPCLTL